MLRAIINKAIGLLTGRMDKSTERGFWLIAEMIAKHKVFLLVLLIAGIFIGFMEGAAIGLIAFSVLLITGEANECHMQIANLSSYLPIDLCNGYDKYDFFMLLVMLSIVVQVVKAGLNYVSSYLAIILKTRVTFDMRNRVMKHIIKLNYEDSNVFSAGEKQHLIGQSSNVTNLVTVFNQVIVTLFILTTYGFMLITLNWKLSLLSIAILLLLTIFAAPLLNKVREISFEQRHNGILLQRKVIDYLLALRLIKLYGKDDQVLESVDETVRKEVGLVRLSAKYANAIQPIQETLMITSAALILIMSVYLSTGDISTALPKILAFIMILHRCNGQIANINQIRSSLAKTMASVQYVSDFMVLKSQQYDRSEGGALPAQWSFLQLCGVDYKYSKSKDYVLKNINLKIKRGQKIAFVGSSGAGKSTLVDLIVGLLKPSSGSVSIDKVTSIEASIDGWARHFSVVSQNDIILNGSVKDNLLFANEKATDEQIVRAAKIADAHNFIADMDDGYDSMLGERGYKVSGGQIQRIAFARAILKDAPVFILDEATSALDTITEQRIIKSLDKVDENKTIIMIAHRLSTVVNADMIVVLDKGEIVDLGSHDELRSKEGIYKDMWAIQSKTNSSEEK